VHTLYKLSHAIHNAGIVFDEDSTSMSESQPPVYMHQSSDMFERHIYQRSVKVFQSHGETISGSLLHKQQIRCTDNLSGVVRITPYPQL